MKSIIRIGRVLGVIIFVCGAVFYFSFSIFYPFLHNHCIIISKKCHHDYHRESQDETPPTDDSSSNCSPNCPTCIFLSKSYLATLADASILIGISYLISDGIYIDQPQSYRQSYHQSFSSRAPPAVSSV